MDSASLSSDEIFASLKLLSGSVLASSTGLDDRLLLGVVGTVEVFMEWLISESAVDPAEVILSVMITYTKSSSFFLLENERNNLRVGERKGQMCRTMYTVMQNKDRGDIRHGKDPRSL